MPRAVILGGTGQIGHATAESLINQGWDVVITSRNSPPVSGDAEHLIVDPQNTDEVSRVVGSNTDLLFSCVAFDANDAKHLLNVSANVGRIISVSSASVYCDALGRSLDEANVCGFPNFEQPLSETSRTLQAGDQNYSTRKVAMEQALLVGALCPVTILRPCAIHGPHSKHAREWWFVKRLLDGRKAIPLAYQGRSIFQTTSVTAIAEAVLAACAGQLEPIVNIADADTPSVTDIGVAIMDVLGVQADLIGLPDEEGYPPKYGCTPWSLPKPMICASSARSKTSYASASKEAVTWLVDNVSKDDWKETLPQLAGYPTDHFDYSADDDALAQRGAAQLFT